jgi:hypothetical protein
VGDIFPLEKNLVCVPERWNILEGLVGGFFNIYILSKKWKI